MKKYILVVAVVVLFGSYVIWNQLKAKTDTSTIPVVDDSGGNSSRHETTNPGAGDPPTPTPTPSPTSTAAYKDGSYTGKVTDAFYGPLQVRAVIKSGKITDVQFLQYPNDRPESIQVNTASNPLLIAEAIKVQSANVDIVSGATQSSEAFQKSLADALAQAK